jgi:hypothetical protein
MVILGVLAAIVLGGTSSNPTTTAVPTARTAMRACIADVGQVEEAANAYLTANLAEPPKGTAWATKSDHGGPFLDHWPSYPRYYTLSWSGVTVVVAPRNGTSAVGSAGTRRPATGCYAI